MGRTIRTDSRHPVVAASRHAAIYTRISRDKEGQKVGVKRQERLCRELADKLGVEVVALFSDNDKSASRKSMKPRPDYDRMLAAAKAGEFSMVISYSTSRLTRRPRQFEDWIDLFDAGGVVVQTVNTDGRNYDLSTARGRGDARKRAADDAEESDEIGERVAAEARDRVLRGEWHGGVPPFGFEKQHQTVVEWDEDEEEDRERVKKGLAIVDREAGLINEAAKRMLDQDETLYSIVKDWNARGDLTRKGTGWKHSVLRNVLTNPALIGTNSAGIESCWTPILDRAIYERLVARLAPDSSRRTNPLGVKSSKYALGGGLVRCGACGGALGVVRRENIDSTKLVCRTRMDEVVPEHAAGAPRVSIDSKALEAYLFERAVAHLDDLPFWEAVRRKRETAETDTAELRAARETQNVEREKVLTQHRLGAIDDRRLMADIALIDAEIDRLTRKIENAHGGPTAQDVWAGRRDALAHWEHWTASEKRLFFRALISKVTVGDWPSGIPTTTLPLKGETPEKFQARRSQNAHSAMQDRVTISWAD